MINSPLIIKLIIYNINYPSTINLSGGAPPDRGHRGDRRPRHRAHQLEGREAADAPEGRVPRRPARPHLRRLQHVNTTAATMTAEVIALKHESRILGQWSNPVSGSRKSQASSPWAKQHRA